MVAFSCCIYDGGEKEKIDMDAARERGWRGKFTKPGRVIIPGAIRLNGSCPLTPLEVLHIILSLQFHPHPLPFSHVSWLLITVFNQTGTLHMVMCVCIDVFVRFREILGVSSSDESRALSFLFSLIA